MAGNTPVFLAETDVRPVVAGTVYGGWISGSPASLAASGSFTAIFDLGSRWDEYNTIVFTINPAAPSSGFAAGVQMYGNDLPSLNTARRLAPTFPAGIALGTAYSAAINTSAGPQSMQCRPCGRYVVVTGTNADGANAMGATAKVTVAAYAD